MVQVRCERQGLADSQVCRGRQEWRSDRRGMVCFRSWMGSAAPSQAKAQGDEKVLCHRQEA